MTMKRIWVIVTWVIYSTSAHFTQLHLSVSLLPNEIYDLHLQCSLDCTRCTNPHTTKPLLESLVFHNSRDSANIKTVLISGRLGSIDLNRCREAVQLAFGPGTLSTCSSTDFGLTTSIKLTGVQEKDLSTWTCAAHFVMPDKYQINSSSSVAYDKAAITHFPDNTEFDVGHLQVVPVTTTNMDRLVIGCSLAGLETKLITAESSEKGVPLKEIRFDVGESSYFGDLFDRSSSEETTACEMGDTNTHSTVCFSMLHGHEDDACDGHSFTLLAEPTRSPKSPVFEPVDTTPYFLFYPREPVPGFEVQLTNYLVFENPPRSISCYPVSGKEGRLCLSPNTLNSVMQTLVQLAVKYTRLRILPINDTILRCDGGELATILSSKCTGGSAPCNSDGGFDKAVRTERLEIINDFRDHGCIVTHYYCFDQPRSVQRYVNLVSVPQQQRFDLSASMSTSADIAAGCNKAHNDISLAEIYDSYSTALMVSATANYSKHMASDIPLISCPCAQQPKTCPGTFPMIATISLSNSSLQEDKRVSCSLFGQQSDVLSLFDLQATLACDSANHEYLYTLAPTLKPTGAAEDGKVVLSCTNSPVACRHNIVVTLSSHDWAGMNGPETYVGERVITDLTYFEAKYDTVQCGWAGTENWQSSRVSEVVSSYTETYRCAINDAYEVEVWLVNNTTVACSAFYQNGCPAVDGLDFQGHVCRGIECSRTAGGHDVSLTLTEQDLSENSTNFTCSITISGKKTSLITSKNIIDLKQNTECHFDHMTPAVIVQHTSARGVIFSCRYPFSEDNVRKCNDGVAMASAQLFSRKVDGDRGILLQPTNETVDTRIYYYLYRQSVFMSGDLHGYVKASGNALPNKYVLDVKVSKKYFDHVTNKGTKGAMVYAQCFFMQNGLILRSSAVPIVSGIVQSYRQGGPPKTESWNIFFVKPPIPSLPGSRPYRGSIPYALLVICLFVVLFVLSVVLSVAISPKYEL